MRLSDLLETKEKMSEKGNGLWANIRAKKKRGEKMRKKGDPGAPTDADIKAARNESQNLKENSSLGSLGVPKEVISKIHKVSRAAHDVDLVPAKNKSELKNGLVQGGFVLVKGNDEYGLAFYSHGHDGPRGNNPTRFKGRVYKEDGSLVGETDGSLTKVMSIMPRGKYHIFNPETKKYNWGNQWKGDTTGWSAKVDWSDPDEMVEKIANRVENTAHKALGKRLVEIKKDMLNTMDPSDDGDYDVKGNYDKMVGSFKHAASIYKKPEEFNKHLKSIIKGYLLKMVSDRTDSYGEPNTSGVSPSSWDKRAWNSPKNRVARKIGDESEGEQFKTEGQFINYIGREVVEFYKNITDIYDDKKNILNVSKNM